MSNILVKSFLMSLFLVFPSYAQNVEVKVNTPVTCEACDKTYNECMPKCGQQDLQCLMTCYSEYATCLSSCSK